MTAASAPESHTSPLQWALLLLIPPMLFLILYIPTIDDDFVWMDKLEIENGALILPTGSLLTAFTRPLHPVSSGGQSNPYYRPLQLLLVNAIYRIGGPQARNFHVVSLLTGALTMSLFAVFAWLLLKNTWWALLAASIPAVHPVSIEPYVWTSAISEGMSALFIVASLVLAWLCLHAADDDRSRLYRLLSPAMFVLALFSKEKAIVVPLLLFAMLVSQVIEARRHVVDMPAELAVRSRGTALISLYLVISVVYLFFFRPLAIGSMGVGPGWIGGSPVTQLTTALAHWPAAIGWLFAPLQSTTSDVVDVVTSFSDIRVWVGLALASGSLIVWVFLLRRGQVAAAFGLAWIWIAFGPTANLIHMLHARADRYLFLSVFGMALFIAAMIPALLSRMHPQARRILGITFSLLLVAGLAQRTLERLPEWASDETLFTADVAGDSYYREGRFYLAMSLFEQGRYAEVEEHTRTLIRFLKVFPDRESYINASDVYELACMNRLAGGSPRRAITLVEELMQDDISEAWNRDVQSCLARAWESSGRYDKAIQILLAVARSMPQGPDIRLSLHLAKNYTRLGNKTGARKWLERARELGNGSLAVRQAVRRIESGGAGR